MVRRATWHEHDRDTDHKIVYIIDDCWGNYLSVTNDAEHILSYYKFTLIPEWRVVYQDTEGEWWEIVDNHTTWMGTGIGFEPWHGLVWDTLKQNEV